MKNEEYILLSSLDELLSFLILNSSFFIRSVALILNSSFKLQQ